MDLAVVTPQLSNYGGSEIYLLECLRRWQEEIDVTLYTPSFNRRLLREFGVTPAVKIVSLPSLASQRGRYKLLQESVILPRLWEQKIRRHDAYFLYLFPTQMIRRHPSVWFAAEPLRMLYDLRHTSYGGALEVEAHFYPKLNYDTVKVPDLDLLLHLIEELDSPLSCDRLATNSRATASYLQNIYGRKPDRVVYPGVNPDGMVSPGPTRGRYAAPARSRDTLLFVGRLWQHKRVNLVIEALSLLPRGKLVVVGEGPEKPLLRKLARDLGVSNRVRFVGDVGKAQLERLYGACTCCVYAPMREPFGMVPLEAAAAGKPVVITKGGGYGEILDDSAALFVPPVAEAIADAIQKLLDDPELARRMGDAGKSAVAPYTWDRTAGSLLELLRETARNGKGRKSVARKPQLGAHYHVWYRAGAQPEHWNENLEFAAVTDPPARGPYSSADPAVVARHLAMARKAGLDFLVVNWQVTFNGVNPTEVAATRELFRRVEENAAPLKLSILLAFDTEDPEIIRDTLGLVRREFVPSPAYQRFGRRALTWYYLNGPFLGYFFYHHQDLLRLNRGCHPIATGSLVYNKFLPRLLRDFFDGWCLHSPLQVGSKQRREAVWTQGYRNFHEDGGAIQAFTICPGYDDTRLTSEQRTSNHYRRVPRNGLQTYRAMQRAALALDPAAALVVISSFNEFHENTHIEPSRKFGDAYLTSTSAFKRQLVSARSALGRASARAVDRSDRGS